MKSKSTPVCDDCGILWSTLKSDFNYKMHVIYCYIWQYLEKVKQGT